MKGVVAGVRDYGNRMGIPTVNGAVYFDKRYLGNPLVYCGNAGLLQSTKRIKNRVLVIGSSPLVAALVAMVFTARHLAVPN